LVGTNFCPKKWVTFFTPNFVPQHIFLSIACSLLGY
jgi:hypothetical protein